MEVVTGAVEVSLIAPMRKHFLNITTAWLKHGHSCTRHPQGQYHVSSNDRSKLNIHKVGGIGGLSQHVAQGIAQQILMCITSGAHGVSSCVLDSYLVATLLKNELKV